MSIWYHVFMSDILDVPITLTVQVIEVRKNTYGGGYSVMLHETADPTGGSSLRIESDSATEFPINKEFTLILKETA